MRKLLSILVIVSFLIVSIPFEGRINSLVRSATSNKKATMIFVKFNPVGYDRDGKKLEGDRNFPWERKGTSYWGRFLRGDPTNSYLMPYVPRARDLSGSPKQVQVPGIAAAWPMYWAEIYLNIDANGGESQETIKWYAVLDDAGQLWLDPDGQFHDPRYNETADPYSSRYSPGSCSDNIMSRMDPIRSNNTQGPYVLNPRHPDFEQKIYFWDRNTQYKAGTDRVWRIGWINMPDYIREGGIDKDNSISSGKVKANDWEVQTTMWDPFSYKERALSEFGSVLYGGTPVFNPIQPHIVNLYQFSSDYMFYDTNGNGTYDSDEYIYRKNTSIPNTLPEVQEGDFRYTPVSVRDGDRVYNYPASNQIEVMAGDKDLNLTLKAFTATPDFQIRFADNKSPGGKYDVGEYIYRDYAPFGKVNVGDVRLTNVYIGGNYLRESGNFSFAEIISHGDVLCLVEVLEANCDSGIKYDISVEADVWEGVNPSTTAARFRSPNKEVAQASNRIQKNTVLDPTGDKFAVPAATFNGIEVKYRSYIGVQVFRDCGYDNNRGLNLPGDTVIPYSLSDDYKPQRIGEEYLGAIDGSTGVPDVGKVLTSFPLYVMYHDIGGEGFGCGESIYRKHDKNTTKLFVEAGDTRLTEVTIDKGDSMVTYQLGSIVAEGDLDIGLALTPFNDGNISTPEYYKFYDELVFNRLDTPDPAELMVANKEYDPNEMIYYDANDNSMVDIGDTRLTEGHMAGVPFECGSKIEYAAEYWFNQSIPHMITLGANGDPRYIDIEVIPGELNLNVETDPPLKVEQTSTVKISLGREPALGEKIYISAKDPKPGMTEQAQVTKLYDDALVSPGEYTGITPGMVDATANAYFYRGNNSWIQVNLWGAGPDGFKIGNNVYDQIYITEDGMAALYRGYPQWPTPYYPYEYVYDYQESYGYWYGGRPYPFSAASQYGGYAYPEGYWYKYPPGQYGTCYKPWQDLIVRNTWIIPLGGQWHIPVQSLWSYPGYYRALSGWGIFYERTNEYLRVVWKVVTYPFTANNSWYHGQNGVPQPGVIPNTSEFEMVLYRSGAIVFNYKDIRIPTGYLYFYNNDVPGADPWTRCQYGAWRYKPMIGISEYYTGMYQLSKYSYKGSAEIPNGSWLNGKSIIWKSPEPPDEGLYAKKEFNVTKVIDRDNPVVEFQYTPYRGSCNDGNHGKDGFRAGTTVFNQFEIRAFVERGGVKVPVPLDSDYTGRFDTNYRDPFWRRSRFNKKEWQENYRKEPFFIIPPEPSPPLPDFLRNAYDCYAWIKLDIAPEDLVIKPSKACIDLVSSRSPNISYTVYDADNPADVNDPANIEVKFRQWFAGYGNQPDSLGNYDYGIDMDKSGSYGHPLIMNFNAHGAGIEYLFTALSGYGQKWQRYIVQVNSDGTYEFWRWFEADLPGQVFGALDPNDMLYTIRGYYIPYGGQWDPVSGNAIPTFKVPDSWMLPAQFLEDMDCSSGLSSCLICGDAFPPLGNITGNDRYGFFGSAGLRGIPATDPCANIPQLYGAAVPSAIITYGVPVVITSPESNFPGGMGLGVANPKNADTPLTIRLYSTNAIYDYNSLIKHPPFFTYDEGPGIDYCGYTTIRVLPQDPVMNFAEMTIADRSLQLSRENYTAGTNAWAPLPSPNPQIMAHYDPILHDWSDMRAYPGGQTHTGRTTTTADRAQPPHVTPGPTPLGSNSGNELKPQAIQNNANSDKMLADVSSTTVKKGYGRNAYPALFRDMFHKLGTEFFPMTDYGLFFILRDPEKNHYTFDPQVLPESLILKRVTIKGPFMLPKMYSEPDSKIDTSYKYEGLENVPIQYDTSGEIVIDANNAALWEVNGIDYNMVINPLRSIPIPLVTGGYNYSTGTYTYTGDKNKYARYTHSLYYGGSDATYGLFYEGDMPRDSNTPNGQYQYFFYSTYYTSWYFYDPTARYWIGNPTNDVYVPNPYYNYDCRIFAIDELIPTGPGKIEITVETGAGVTKIYQDCCQEQITDGITTEGLEINNQTKEFLVDADNTLELTLNEYDKKCDENASTYCNDAVLVAWQDRGVIDPNTGRLIGAGDGWLTNPPRSSDYINIGTQYLPSDDLNGNGKVSFNDWETEILGSYDLATNTWSSGIIDARTFHRNNGKYIMEFTENNGSRIDTIGIDFGGINLRQRGALTYPDGVISDDEVLPIIINAYKYGDDNSDRGFTPFYNLPGEFPQYSHEVYLTGRVEIPIRSQNVYSVSYTPDPLTAGVQPELQDPTEPLTIYVNDETGAPVDLLSEAKKLRTGVKEEDVDPIALEKAIWNGLIKDPHPDPLPQYYWLRTDLHNDDGTVIGNTMLYSNDMGKFTPIDFDISGSRQGKYVFKGFTANDAGSFDVFVYSPDRRKMGKTTVKVELPSVTYKVSNYDDPGKREFDVPGDPDFVLTAGDNMIYKIHVTAKDAQGRPLKGIGQTVSICGGSAQEVSRFTPFVTTHRNYYRCIEPWYWHFYGTGKGNWIRDYYYNGQYSWYDISPDNWGDRWNTHIGVDLDNDGVLEPTNNELERVRPMAYVMFYVTYYGYAGYFRTLGGAYYNTECVKFDDGTFATKPMFDCNAKLNPYPGWGLGCIYNRPYYTEGNYGMVFANLDKFGDDNYYMKYVNISNTDSLNLNVNGETEFYVFGEDVCEVGGLVGKNSWSISPWGDVVGSQASYRPTSPNSIKTRFGRKIVLPAGYAGREAYFSPKDYSYRLDWDAMPSNVVKIRPPKVEPLNAEDLTPIGKSLFNEDAYDLIYGAENHIKFNFYPADKRDIPLKGDITMVLAGNEHEYRVSGRVDPTGKNPGDPAETTMFITPTGTGLTSISLDLTVRNLRKDMMRWEVYRLREPRLPDDYYIFDLAQFDVAKGLNIEIVSISGPLTLNNKATLKVVVTEIGTKAPVKGADVAISGAGVKASGKTDENGLCYFDVTPQTKEAIIVTAKKDGYIIGKAIIDIGMNSGRKDLVKFDELPLKTRNPEFELRGEVSEEAVKVLVNGSPVKINEDRTFEATIILKEGFNTVIVEVEDRDGRTTRKIITIELKTKGPTLIIDDAVFSQKLVDVKDVSVTGKIDPNSTLEVNGILAKVDGNSFYVTIPLNKGINKITFKATDELGNITEETKEIYVYTKRKVELIVGSKTVRVDDKDVALVEAPFIANGRTYVPLRLISEAFGASVAWNNETKGVTIVKDGKKVDMVIGSSKALVNDKVVELDAPPIIRGGLTFVPVRFVSEVLGGEVLWNERIKLVLIEFLI